MTAGALHELAETAEGGFAEPGLLQDSRFTFFRVAGRSEGLATEDGAGVNDLARVEARLLALRILGDVSPAG